MRYGENEYNNLQTKNNPRRFLWQKKIPNPKRR